MTDMSSLLPDFNDGESHREFIKSEFEPILAGKSEPKIWQSLLPETKSEINLPDLSGFPSAELITPELPSLEEEPAEPSFDTMNALDDAFSISDALDLSVEQSVTEIPEIAELPSDPTILVAEHEAQISDLTSQFEDQILDLKQSHREQMVSRLEECQTQIVEQLNAQLETAVAMALSPIANKLMSEKAVANLVAEIGSLVDRDALEPMQLCGPVDLIEHAKSLLNDDNPSLKFVESDTVDLTLNLRDGVISTRLESWSENLKGVHDG